MNAYAELIDFPYYCLRLTLYDADWPMSEVPSILCYYHFTYHALPGRKIAVAGHAMAEQGFHLDYPVSISQLKS